MAYCYCDGCEFKNDCKHYRKVIICPYLEEYNESLENKLYGKRSNSYS